MNFSKDSDLHIFIHNLTNSLNESMIDLFSSYDTLNMAKKINVICVIIVILIGLIGNSITAFVFLQSRFRINSSHVYLLSLALIDSSFLLIHFLEDTIRTYESIVVDTILDDNFNSFIKSLNIVNSNDFICKLISYLRYVIRLISSFLIMAFTLQRLFVVYNPLKNKFKSKKSAWKTVFTIILISLVLNMWVPFLFQIRTNRFNDKYCDNNEKMFIQYFYLNIIYIFLIMILPIFVIIISNLLIIHKTKKDETNRVKLLHSSSITYWKNLNKRSKSIISQKSQFSTTNFNKLTSFNSMYLNEPKSNLRPYYFNIQNHKINFRSISSRKITVMFIAVSFSFTSLEFPFLVCWLVYFYFKNFHSFNIDYDDNIYAAFKISEIFYVLNYSIKFFIYSASSSRFRQNLIDSSELLLK
jgi:hypothetical protein